MENRFLEIINNINVDVKLCGNEWRIRIPDDLLSVAEHEQLKNKWDIPNGDNSKDTRRIVADRLYDMVNKY